MSIPKGYAGNVLIIDLNDMKADILPIEAFWHDYGIEPRTWLGGDGFITKILWKDFSGPIDPLSAENEIIIASGPWTATAAPQAGRGMLGCIDPETGGFGSGSFGWFFPSALKFAGFDLTIIRGRARRPVYVFVDDRKIVFKEASHLWGKETGETVRMIREELQERFEGEIRVLCTSIAGENLVRYAPPCADGTSSPGRTGAGAVMGSKNLKAVAVRGTGEVPLEDPRGLLESSLRAVETFLKTEPLLKLWQEQGATTCLATTGNWPLNGAMLAENRQDADFPHFKNVGCLNCPVPCYHWLQIKEGKFTGLRHLGGHMTYLTNCLRNLGISDFGEWIYFERYLQELGMDPASFSMGFAWAVDCFERGLLTLDQTDGMVLKQGDADLIWEVARKVAHREGNLGDLLAEGLAAASGKMGKEAERIAPHVKGKPYIQKDARLQALMWSLGFLTSPRGGDWLRLHNVWELAFTPEKIDRYPQFLGKNCTEMYAQAMDLIDIPDGLKKRIFGEAERVDVAWIKGTAGKALFSAWTEDLVALFNSLVTCMFGAPAQFLMVGIGPTTYAEILNKITGWNVTPEELMKTGERVFNLQRLFNYKIKGWDRRQDAWADKRAYEPSKMGIYKGRTVPWDQVLLEYYAVRGWSENGLPSREKLVELGLEDMAEEARLSE
ncbi:MAG: aldehyde ferredoxin oxidoreductase family protein [Desulfatiglandales bacterium]